jgi:hypothetical protein
MRRLLILVLTLGLAACAAVGPRPGPSIGAPLARAASGRPAEGLWAILDPGCPKPGHIDVRAWPKCASPFWISGGSALVVRTRAGPRGTTPDHSYRAGISLAGADPLIAQVGDGAGHLYLALTQLARDDKGRLVGAAGAAFACPGQVAGLISLAANTSGCEAVSSDGLRQAARATLRDQPALTRVAWIAPGAP